MREWNRTPRAVAFDSPQQCECNHVHIAHTNICFAQPHCAASALHALVFNSFYVKDLFLLSVTWHPGNAGIENASQNRLGVWRTSTRHIACDTHLIREFGNRPYARQFVNCPILPHFVLCILRVGTCAVGSMWEYQ